MSTKLLDEIVDKGKKTEIIFDLDRTLADVEIEWNDEFRNKFREGLKVLDKDMVEKYPTGLSSTNMLSYEMQKKYGDKAKKIVDRFCSDWEGSHFHGVKANKGLVEWVKSRKDLNFHLWTTNQTGTADKALELLGLTGRFKKIITANDVKYIKPDSYGFKLIKDENIEKDRYLFIGDSEFDEKAAEEAGIDFVNVFELRWE